MIAKTQSEMTWDINVNKIRAPKRTEPAHRERENQMANSCADYGTSREGALRVIVCSFQLLAIINRAAMNQAWFYM